MNSLLFIVASLIVFQGDEKVKYTIRNHSTFAYGIPYNLVTPQGTGLIPGSISLIRIEVDAGNFNAMNQFVLDPSLPANQATVSKGGNEEYNWISPSFSLPMDKSIVVRVRLCTSEPTPPPVAKRRFFPGRERIRASAPAFTLVVLDTKYSTLPFGPDYGNPSKKPK